MADAKTMPPLPPVDGYGARPEGHYSADQMREYAQTCAAAPCAGLVRAAEYMEARAVESDDLVKLHDEGGYGFGADLARGAARERRDFASDFRAMAAAPQPAASDVPHDVVRAQTIEECAKLVEEVVTTTQSFEQTDHNDLYTGTFEHREVRYWKWGSRALGIAKAIRSLATPAPSTSTEPDVDAWAYAFANYRQGQRSTPSCEEPGAADIRICRDLIKGMLACRPAPSTSTERCEDCGGTGLVLNSIGEPDDCRDCDGGFRAPTSTEEALEPVAWQVPVKASGKRYNEYTEALPFSPLVGTVKVMGEPVPLYAATPSSTEEALRALIDETGSKDAENMADMARIGHACMEEIERLDRAYSNCPSEVIVDLANALDEAERGRGDAIATVLAAEDTRQAATELRAENARLRAALRNNFCPRPCNHRPDQFGVGQCVDAGECGCMNVTALSALSR